MNLEPIVNSVHWHYGRWIDKDTLRFYAEQYLETVDEEMRELDRVVRAYLESVARAEKARLAGYSVDDECFYTPGVIARLLPVALDIEDALHPTFDPEAEHRGGGTHGDFVTSLLDVRAAWIGAAFRGAEMQLIEARYVKDLEWERIAGTYGMTVEQAQATAARGLRRMVDHLGGRDPRKVLRDAASQE